jgi:hypothetical protein
VVGVEVGVVLGQAEVAELLKVSGRSVQRMVAAGKLTRSGRGRYDLASLPVDAAMEWARRERRTAVELPSTPGQLALGLSLAIGPNLSDADLAEAERRCEILAPLISPDKFLGLWAACGERRMAVVDLLVSQHGVSRGTIYHWLQAWKASGVHGLVRRERSDKGLPLCPKIREDFGRVRRVTDSLPPAGWRILIEGFRAGRPSLKIVIDLGMAGFHISRAVVSRRAAEWRAGERRRVEVERGVNGGFEKS